MLKRSLSSCVHCLIQTDVAANLNDTFGPGVVTLAEVAPLYPGLSGFDEIAAIQGDFGFVW